ncbi:MAG: glucan biosynthesis protein G [Paracoccaceae bacterium]|nr:glucan biosynthesis protein G [Paracoccaceae bacterium]
MLDASPAHLPRLTRRSLLAAGTATAVLLATTALPLGAMAEDAPGPAAPQKFSFDILTQQMRELSKKPYVAPQKVTSFLGALKYDDYQRIQYNPDRARWNTPGSFFRMDAFHLGWLFDTPVMLDEVADGMARDFTFTTDDFIYHGDLAAKVPAKTALQGVAGFRLRYPLNRADIFDEIVAFIGASYFRALGEGNTYGLSARGLAINTGLPGAEEFPRFSAFYLERPAPGAQSVVVNAALESPSCTGAYRFVISPGENTVMEVTARLFFRAAVQQLGVAPLTSMFLYSDVNRAGFDDYRPQVHDSDGLMIRRADGDVMWRQLNNPPRLGSSVFALKSPKTFGLHQRDRNYADYQDVGAKYEKRPSIDVEPIGDWGEGAVRLVEIPSELEVNDNIVAFWIPSAPVKAGDELEFRYRLKWGNLPPDSRGQRAYVHDTRAGHGGISGSKPTPGLRKFVIDFKGGLLANMPGDAEVQPVVTVSHGKIVTQTLFKVSGSDIWRLVIDFSASAGSIVELTAHIAGYGRKLTEVWLYQWMRN